MGTTLAESGVLLEPLLDEAEDGYDEGAKIHKQKTSAASGTIESTPNVGKFSL